MDKALEWCQGKAKELLKYKGLGNIASEDGVMIIKGNGTIYRLLSEIGKGGYGTVYRALNTQTNELLAIKVMNQYHSQVDTIDESKIHELMGTSRGKPIISKFGRNAILMQLIEGKKLETELLDPHSKHEPLKLYRNAKQLIRKMHKLGYSHGDTNSGNFLVTEDGTVFVIDFGDSRRFRDLESRIKDFEKLAGNVVEELQFRQNADALLCRDEATFDLKNAESLVHDFISIGRFRSTGEITC